MNNAALSAARLTFLTATAVEVLPAALRRCLGWLAPLALAPLLAAQTSTPIAVRVDPRVELLSIVFRLGGNPEYSEGRVPGYIKAVDAWFAPYKEHAVVQQARSLRQRRGISYDAVASFAIHLDGIDPPRFAVPLTRRPERLEGRWTVPDATTFLQNLAAFVADSKAIEFFAKQKDLYTHAEAQMRKLLADNADLTWFATFFGTRPAARFQLVLGLLNGSNNYGPSAVLRDGGEDLYAILGCWQVDEQGQPKYEPTVMPTLVHEYCHSYCNPVVDAHLKALQPAGAALFALTAEAMKQQAYANSRTLLCESLVRACVVRYRAAVEGDQAAGEEIKVQHQRSFYWTGDLAALLADGYEKDRPTYPTLQAFGPQLATFFLDAASKLEAYFATVPKVVSMVPANGGKDIDPATTALVITFDRAMMDRSWTVTGNGEQLPEIPGKCSYDAECKVLTVPLKLKPNRSYELWLNRGKSGFRSADGTPLQPLQVTFQTRTE